MYYISNEILRGENEMIWHDLKKLDIDLPPANIKRTTIRINEKVWDLFNQFVEDKKIYDKHDLMEQALI